MTEFWHNQVTVPISWYAGHDSLVAERIRAADAEMIRQMYQRLYGDGAPVKLRLTVLQRIQRRIATYRERVRDAWEVFRGRADIYG